MLVAWPQHGKETFYIESLQYRRSETYHARERLKAAGATWDGHHWIITDEQRQALNIQKMVRVETEMCHEKPQIEWIPQTEAFVGNLIAVFCGLCDGKSYQRITKIL